MASCSAITTPGCSDRRRRTRHCSPNVVVCATPACSPLFDSDLLATTPSWSPSGFHEPDARELDAPLLGRASVIVEDVATALREAGDVILAIAAAPCS